MAFGRCVWQHKLLGSASDDVYCPFDVSVLCWMIKFIFGRHFLSSFVLSPFSEFTFDLDLILNEAGLRLMS